LGGLGALSKFDRYVLSQLLLLFGFFSLILVAVFWINRAVVLFDRLIADGQSAMVFLEFTALGLPNLIRMVLPMSAFAAAVYVTNRLNSESELAVVQATGSSPWQMARPVALFGVIVGLMMAVLTNVLLPASISQLGVREAEVSQNTTARLLSEGTFLHPAPGVTFYIRSIDPDGTLNDVFLSDRRAPEKTVTYTAAQAFLVRDKGQSKLIMVDGLAQQFLEDDRRLSTTNFADFSYDISSLIHNPARSGRSIRALPTLELMFDQDTIARVEGYEKGHLVEELHLRFARPLICVAVALIGFSALLLGGFSRFGVWRQIVLAFTLLILMELARGVVSDPVHRSPGLWPLIYLPGLVGLGFGGLFLYLSAHPVLLRRSRRFEATS
jgi:lipopolysaccharide export system permease protein